MRCGCGFRALEYLGNAEEAKAKKDADKTGAIQKLFDQAREEKDSRDRGAGKGNSRSDRTNMA